MYLCVCVRERVREREGRRELIKIMEKRDGKKLKRHEGMDNETYREEKKEKI